MPNIILFISGSEIFIILLVVLLLFGANKIPEIARGLGKGFHEFRKATHDIRNEFNEQTRDIKNEVNEIKSNLQDDFKFDDEAQKNEPSDDPKTHRHKENSSESSTHSEDTDSLDDSYKDNPHDPK